MHELSLATHLVELAGQTASRERAQRVLTVKLRVGLLADVSVEALQFAYEVATADTLLAGSRLEVEEVPVTVFCEQCQTEAVLPSIQNFRCPECNMPTENVLSGRELEIAWIELE
ncbi:hydrogenase maturation nickel metallochaperone HypA [Telmatocola sphagniphila]|uniref:Hydrogenase maturation factor HypA n=1 Tax=Telmatocola sphagniphila TaxID=1123043 RepID=A0A8E6EVD3_9BACT|nr:hydrogenase maturation nickel metallochaperone HypA [Telmatocola sphagniphila]QVL32452.1 hydrogenase maturation nickel metallochaperone HypA [Telmatocola sphagniphila]